jgi:hypothetical protein
MFGGIVQNQFAHLHPCMREEGFCGNTDQESTGDNSPCQKDAQDKRVEETVVVGRVKPNPQPKKRI